MVTNNGKLHPLIGVGVMVIRNGKVLLGYRKGAHGSNTYGWCGGHLEFGEKLEDCAKREVLEETGLVISSLRLFCVSNIISYGKHYVDLEFLAEISQGEPRILEPDRVESWDWYDFDNLPSPLFKAVELAIHSYLTDQFYNP